VAFEEEIRERAVASANSGIDANSCGTPANVCSSAGTIASRSSLRNSWLLSGGTVTSASPWNSTVGGKLLMYAPGVASRQASSLLPAGIGNPRDHPSHAGPVTA
jgi:hypothetical protein